jgi:hypothetical protein
MRFRKGSIQGIGMISLLALGGCEPGSSGSGIRIQAEFSPCRSASAKEGAAQAPGADSALLVHQSRDSLHIRIDSLYLQCQSKYAVASPVMLSNQELSARLNRTFNSGAKCVCNQPLDLRIRSAGEDFSEVKIFYLEGQAYELASPKKSSGS